MKELDDITGAIVDAALKIHMELRQAELLCSDWCGQS